VSQSGRGKTLYDSKRRSCHGTALDDGEFAPPLKGDAFLGRGGGKDVDGLHNSIVDRLPSTQPGTLTSDEGKNLVADLMDQDRIPAGSLMLTKRARRFPPSQRAPA
jgi:hypothetical protein